MLMVLSVHVTSVLFLVSTPAALEAINLHKLLLSFLSAILTLVTVRPLTLPQHWE